MGFDELKQLRGKIDGLDEKLVKLLNRRAKWVRKVGEWKAKNKKQIQDPRREAFIFERITRLNPGPLSTSDILGMMADLIRAFRVFEERGCGEVGNGAVRKVSVIGTGLMGGSLALALARHSQSYCQSYRQSYRLMGFDLQGKAALRGTEVARAFESFATSPQKALDADIIILAMPVGEILRFLKRYGRAFKAGSVVMDLGSTKSEICKTAWKILPRSVTFVGGHPLAGKATAGASAAEAELFRGRPFILVPQPHPQDPKIVEDALAELKNLALALGARPQICEARQHDAMMAFTSHLPQMISVALTLSTRRRWKKNADSLLYGPAFTEMTRLALSDYRMWLDIARTNRGELDSAIAAFGQTLSGLRAALGRGQFSSEFKVAQQFRKKWIQPK